MVIQYLVQTYIFQNYQIKERLLLVYFRVGRLFSIERTQHNCFICSLCEIFLAHGWWSRYISGSSADSFLRLHLNRIVGNTVQLFRSFICVRHLIFCPTERFLRLGVRPKETPDPTKYSPRFIVVYLKWYFVITPIFLLYTGTKS